MAIVITSGCIKQEKYPTTTTLPYQKSFGNEDFTITIPKYANSGDRILIEVTFNFIPENNVNTYVGLVSTPYSDFIVRDANLNWKWSNKGQGVGYYLVIPDDVSGTHYICLLVEDAITNMDLMSKCDSIEIR